MTASLAGCPLAVVLASIDATTNLRPTLERWFDELDGCDEVLVVDSSRDGTADAIAAAFPRVRLLRRPPGRLAPELWRDGLEATDGPLVALSTTRMSPAPGWRRAMLERLEATGAAGAGGPIQPLDSYDGDHVSMAVYLLRYIQYLPPLVAPECIEPPGDNAVYVRDRLEGLEFYWKQGFWEVEIHRALRARGEALVMAGDGAVVHAAEGRLFPLLSQRYAHARHYGASRARHLDPVERLLRIVAAPLVPPVLLRRIVAALRARGQPLGPWLPALPCLLPLMAAWTLGEARGMSLGLLTRREGKSEIRNRKSETNSKFKIQKKKTSADAHSVRK